MIQLTWMVNIMCVSRSFVFDSLQSHRLQLARLLYPWDSPGKNTGLPFPSPEDLPNPGIKPWSPALQADSLLSEPPGSPISHHQPQGNANENYCFTHTRITINQKRKITTVGESVESYITKWDCKWCSLYVKHFGEFFNQLNIELTCDPAILLLVVDPQN